MPNVPQRRSNAAPFWLALPFAVVAACSAAPGNESHLSTASADTGGCGYLETPMGTTSGECSYDPNASELVAAPGTPLPGCTTYTASGQLHYQVSCNQVNAQFVIHGYVSSAPTPCQAPGTIPRVQCPDATSAVMTSGAFLLSGDGGCPFNRTPLCQQAALAKPDEFFAQPYPVPPTDPQTGTGSCCLPGPSCSANPGPRGGCNVISNGCPPDLTPVAVFHQGESFNPNMFGDGSEPPDYCTCTCLPVVDAGTGDGGSSSSGSSGGGSSGGS